MKIRRALVCAPHLPEFDREGGSRRILHLIELLLETGWAVTFICRNPNGEERYARMLRQRGVTVYPGWELQGVGDEYLITPERLIEIGHFDLALLCFWETAEAFLRPLRALSPATRVVVDSIDLHFIRNARTNFQRMADGKSGGLDADYGDKMVRELNAYAAVDAVLTVSQREADLVNDLVADLTLAHAVPDIEEPALAPPPLAERQGILFVGNFRHPPNVDAIGYLCREILPLIDPALLAAHPLSIVGNGLDRIADELACDSPHVRLVGWVPSVVPYLAQARLTVVPLRTGAGTKRKLIQALMAGTPTVSTSVGIEGLQLQVGEHVLLADDPPAFAAEVTRLLTDAALWARLAAQGRERIVTLHSRELVRARFAAAIDATLARPHRQARLPDLFGGRPDAALEPGIPDAGHVSVNSVG